MNIVADENIPLLREFFDSFGGIRALPGRTLSAGLVAEADVLLVRSVTPVNEALLSGSSVKFVGTTTIGLDHIDTNYLQQQGIEFCSAPGCNASAVVEYVISVLSVLSEQQGFCLAEKSIGLVGHGQIGSRLALALRSMGVNVKAHDPPKEAAGERGLCNLADIMACDIISVHVPLVESGPWPTRNLFNAERIKDLQEEQIFINTSRGDVLDEQALKNRLQAHNPPTVVLDVFQHEPKIDCELAQLCWFSTPHIAGYSLEGKVNGTDRVYRSLCHYSGLPVRHTATDFLPEPALRTLVYSAATDFNFGFNTALRAGYDVRFDDSKLRQTFMLGPAARALAFDQLRKNYRQRRSFAATEIKVPESQAELIKCLAAVGFIVHRQP